MDSDSDDNTSDSWDAICKKLQSWDVQARFSHYYKYVFYYIGHGVNRAGERIHLEGQYGGNHNDIYGHEVAWDSQEDWDMMDRVCESSRTSCDFCTKPQDR